MAVKEFPPIRKWLKELPWKAKPRVPCERAYKTVSETGVKSDPAFCLGPPIKKTNSDERIFYDFIREVRMKVDSTLSAERSSSTNGEDPLSMRVTYREMKGKNNCPDRVSQKN